ncbi:MAG: BON domain-containing protein [Stenotrophobium sp.]
MKLNPVYYGISAALLLSAGSVAYADDTGTTTQPQSANVGTAISDTDITAKVKAKYMVDTRLKNTDISVTTTNGTVTLTGSVPSSDAKTAAEELAKNVSGVNKVDDQLQAPSVASSIEAETKHVAKKTQRVVSDSWITTKVKSSLLADNITKGFNISVKTIHHVVILSGTVDTQASVAHAEDLAKQVDGVASVDADNLKATNN